MSAQRLITEHIDLWTSTIKARNTQGRGSSKKRELYGIQKLRELILELAVRGKLVAQDPADEPASDLLKRIAIEKEQKIRDKRIKNQKILLDVSDEEAAFVLPKGWEWTLLPNISSYMTGKTPATKNSVFWGDTLADCPWVSIADMNHYGRVVETKKRVTQEAIEKVFKYPPVKAGTLLMSFKLTLGKVSILDVDAFHNEAIISIHPFSGVDKDYLFRILPARALAGNSKKAIKGNTLNSDSISRISIPLPPIAEQHRIVAKVDELMALCDQLEQQTESSLDAHNLLVDTLLATLTDARDANELGDNWVRLADHFDTLITTDYAVEQLKQTILQLAVMGKLVPQDPNDEPASELLKRIAKEKEELIKDKKIKKQKSLLEIDDEKKSHSIPDGWVWSNLTNVFALVTDGDHQAPPKAENGIPFLVIGNLNTGIVNFEGCRFVPESYYNALDWGRQPKSGDVLYTVTGSYGIPILIQSNNRFCVQRHVAILKATISTPVNYVKYALMSKGAFSYAASIATGIAQKTVPLTGLRIMPIPVPPIEEQYRIVSKIDKLMALCDQLETELYNARIAKINFADAVVNKSLK